LKILVSVVRFRPRPPRIQTVAFRRLFSFLFVYKVTDGFSTLLLALFVGAQSVDLTSGDDKSFLTILATDTHANKCPLNGPSNHHPTTKPIP
jgi:hypothetical protein